MLVSWAAGHPALVGVPGLLVMAGLAVVGAVVSRARRRSRSGPGRYGSNGDVVGAMVGYVLGLVLTVALSHQAGIATQHTVAVALVDRYDVRVSTPADLPTEAGRPVGVDLLLPGELQPQPCEVTFRGVRHPVEATCDGAVLLPVHG